MLHNYQVQDYFGQFACMSSVIFFTSVPFFFTSSGVAFNKQVAIFFAQKVAGPVIRIGANVLAVCGLRYFEHSLRTYAANLLHHFQQSQKWNLKGSFVSFACAVFVHATVSARLVLLRWVNTLH